MVLDLGDFMQRHGCLISCWIHECKHKPAKRFATQTADTSKGIEESVLKDILAVQLKALEHEMPSCQVGLLQKRKASKRLTQLLHESFDCHLPCFTSGDVAVCSPQGTEYRG